MMKPSLLRQIAAPALWSGWNQRCLSIAAGPGCQKSGFFGSFFEPRKIQVQDSSHSQKLSSKEEIVEVQTHHVRPDCVGKYLQVHKALCEFFAANEKEGLKLGCICVGNFNVFVGEQDQFLHFWRFQDGYQTLDRGNQALTKHPEYNALRRDILACLRSRSNHYVMTFSYWPEPYMRAKCPGGQSHVYELRSYHLKPGTMVEWGNYWARAIRMRDYNHNEAFMGTFSQVGDLYNVSHVWCYDSLIDRQKARDMVWQKQQMQWSEIVSHTMPLIRHMSSSIMAPTDYSPTQ